MAYPTTKQTFSQTQASDRTDTVDHNGIHNNLATTVNALQDKVGINSDTATTSFDYKLSEITSTDKAVGKSATQTLTNKTLTSPTLTTPKIANAGSINDANDNEYLKFSQTASAVNEVNITNNTAGNAPIVGVSGGDTNIDLSLKGKGAGKVSLGTANIKFPNADGLAGQVLQTDGAGNLSFLSASNAPEILSSNNFTSNAQAPFMNSFSDTASGVCYLTTTSVNVNFSSALVAGGYQLRDISTDWASADSAVSGVVIGSYLYLMLYDTSTAYRVYRYDKNNLSAGGTQMTFSGQSLAFNSAEQRMTSDGTNFYFNHKAGNSANSYVVSKYTLSGTTLTYVSDITCGSTAGDVGRFLMVDLSGNIYGVNTSSRVIKKFNSSGTLQTTYNALPTYTGLAQSYYSFGEIPYVQNVIVDGNAQSRYFMNRFYI